MFFLNVLNILKDSWNMVNFHEFFFCWNFESVRTYFKIFFFFLIYSVSMVIFQIFKK
jgi:hypothetical protein